MPNKSRIGLEVHEETKQRWRDAVDESAAYSSLSDLIRQSVAKELADDSDPSGETSEASIDGEALNRISEGVSTIEGRLGEIEGRLAELESDTTTPDDSLTRTKIFQYLDHADGPQTTEEIAANINMPIEDVEENLNRVAERTPLLESVDGGWQAEDDL